MIERNPPYQDKVVEAKLAVPRSGDAAYSDGPTSAAHMCAPRREPVGTSDLKEQLEQAVREERYEDAARLRDLIRAQGVGPPTQTSGSSPPAGESTSDIRERLRQREISRLRDIDTDGDNMATPF